MMKNGELSAAPQITPSVEFGADPPSPGHTDDEASDEEGGQAQLESDDEETTGDKLATRQCTRQELRWFRGATCPRTSLTIIAVAP